MGKLKTLIFYPKRNDMARQNLRVSAVLSVLLLTLFVPCLALAQPIAEGEQLTLSRAIEIALANQPTIRAGQSQVRVNEARIGQAQANYYPQLAYTADYSRISPASSSNRVFTAGSGTSVSTGGAYDQYTTGVGLNQLVYDFGKTGSQVKAQRFSTEASRFDLQNIRQVVVFNVRQSYYALLAGQRLTTVAQESVKGFQHHLDQARGFFDVGLRPKFDVTKAEVDLGSARLGLIKAENLVRLSRVTLNNNLGLTDVPEYRVEEILSFERYMLPFDEALRKAYEQRPDLLSIRAQKEASREQVNVAKKNYFPVLTGNASHTYAGTSFPLDHGWQFGLELNFPIFSGFLTTYQVAEARSTYDVVSANEAKLRQSALLEVQQTYLSLREADESVQTTDLTVRQARENLDLAQGRYDAGVGNPIEVSDALVAYATAQGNYISALYNYKTASAGIEKAIGVNW